MKWYSVIVLSVCCVAQEYTIETVKLPPTNDSDTHTRIIGGTVTTIQRFPYIVQVQYLRRLACGGSLVTRRHVLTAAHCFFDERGRFVSHTHYTVRAGTSNLEKGGSVRSVSTVIVHERYNTPIRDNDIAVMLLTSAVRLGAKIAVVPIPVQGEEVSDNVAVTHVGWGRTNVNVPAASQTLREVEIRTVSYEVCREQYQMLEGLTNRSFPVTRNMICSGLLGIGGKDACQGDSGGPLVYLGVPGGIVVGVTSWGYGCAEPRFPGVNAKAAAYTNWVNVTITRYNASPQLGNVSGILMTISLLSSLILGDFSSLK